MKILCDVNPIPYKNVSNKMLYCPEDMIQVNVHVHVKTLHFDTVYYINFNIFFIPFLFLIFDSFPQDDMLFHAPINFYPYQHISYLLSNTS